MAVVNIIRKLKKKVVADGTAAWEDAYLGTSEDYVACEDKDTDDPDAVTTLKQVLDSIRTKNTHQEERLTLQDENIQQLLEDMKTIKENILAAEFAKIAAATEPTEE